MRSLQFAFMRNEMKQMKERKKCFGMQCAIYASSSSVVILQFENAL